MKHVGKNAIYNLDDLVESLKDVRRRDLYLQYGQDADANAYFAYFAKRCEIPGVALYTLTPEEKQLFSGRLIFDNKVRGEQFSADLPGNQPEDLSEDPDLGYLMLNEELDGVDTVKAQKNDFSTAADQIFVPTKIPHTPGELFNAHIILESAWMKDAIDLEIARKENANAIVSAKNTRFVPAYQILKNDEMPRCFLPAFKDQYVKPYQRTVKIYKYQKPEPNDATLFKVGRKISTALASNVKASAVPVCGLKRFTPDLLSESSY